MKVLFLNAYFIPEQTAFTHLEHDLIEGILNDDDDNEIYVLTPIPTRGITRIIRKKYCKVYEDEMYEGKVHVKRFWAPQEGANFILRISRYLICNFQAYRYRKKYMDIDVILAPSTPPTQGILASKIAKYIQKRSNKYVSVVYNLQDIFPDSLVNAGKTSKGSFVWKIGRMIESYTYKHSDKIITINESCRKNIETKGVEHEKIAVISNWIDLKLITPVSRSNNSLIKELGIPEDKFLVVYAGNFGVAQGAEIILDVANSLKNYKDILFVVFGGGSLYSKVKSVIQTKKISNIMAFDLQPQDRISEVYSLGDVALIICKKGTGKAGMPSKTWNIMACNTPIIASFDLDSELGKCIENSGSGKCVEPEDVNALQETIVEVYKRRNRNKIVNTRVYVERVAAKEECVENYIQILKKCCMR